LAYEVEFTPDAANQLRALRVYDRAKIAEQCIDFLSTNPTLESKSRIKRMREHTFPPFRLRVEDYRVFYDVDELQKRVMIYGVVSKEQANVWLAAFDEVRKYETDDGEGSPGESP
jgi:mRNA-degrading endonuclease RelE of RelBE toxin-antitoxin system